MHRLTQAALVLTLTLSLPILAQEKGLWGAASTTASGITGDVTFGNEKLTINFATFPLAQIRPLKFEELSAVFQDDLPANTTGNIFRISIPGEKKFLHKNTLCGNEETQWVVSAVSGKQLRLAFFSGAKIPVLTMDAIGKSTDLCGTFTYAR